MAPYSQTCACRGRGISAVKDARRYEQEAHDIGLDIAKLERERVAVQDKARRARLRILSTPTGTCSVCQDSGVVVSRGEIGHGGTTGGYRATDWKDAERIG